MTDAKLVFDQPHARRINEDRFDTLGRILDAVTQDLQLSTAVDVGCGPGYFSEFLHSNDFTVTGVDAREENIQEAKKRHPHITFQTGNVESDDFDTLGTFDLTLSTGLLYHLENPIRAIRNVAAVTRNLLIVESFCFPTEGANAFLVDENPGADQSIYSLALIPSKAMFVKILYASGFPFVYLTTIETAHPDFATPSPAARRVFFVASRAPLNNSIFVPQPHYPPRFLGHIGKDSFVARLQRFLQQPAKQQASTLVRKTLQSFSQTRWAPKRKRTRVFQNMTWILADDYCSSQIEQGNFEPSETLFIQKHIQPGMTAFDIGAHHGYYSLLLSQCVGPTGKVFSFEPSHREFAQLAQHIALNHCQNVSLERCAIGDKRGNNTLFVVQGRDSGCNSLRPPLVNDPILQEQVTVETLDAFLGSRGISPDFIKLDAEGSELSILHGGPNLLGSNKRPVILLEVSHLRTGPWGYDPSQIVRLLQDAAFQLYQVSPGGFLANLVYDGPLNTNVVAVPRERLGELAPLLA